jgi:TetR/AcrR family transcriptional regulator, transcriptional repressor for nem operon
MNEQNPPAEFPGNYPRGVGQHTIAREMSALDDGFRGRIERLYEEWRDCLAAAMTRGIKAGKVKPGTSVDNTALFLIAAHTGIGAAKNAQSPQLMARAGEALFAYLDTPAA